MSHFPILKPKELIAMLRHMGFQETRQRGSHKHFSHPDGRWTTVVYHAGRDISPVLLRQVLGDIGLSPQDLPSYA